MLYTQNGAYPAPLPFRIRLLDGRVRTKPESFTPQEIADAGFVAVGPKPAPTINQTVTWGGSDWVVYTKNTEEVAAEEAAALEESREVMVVSRASFALACYYAGILDEAETEAWVGGTALPNFVVAALEAALPQEERLAARVEALSTPTVRRRAPLLLLLQASLTLSEESVDALFIKQKGT